MQEYETVKSVRKLNENIPKDAIGTIVMVFESNVYEVEFVDENGNTIDVITVREDDIIRMDQ